MTNLLKLGSDLLEKKFEESASEQIEFEKIDTCEKAALLATIGRTTADAQEQALQTEFDSQDFVIRVWTPVTLNPPPATELTFGDWMGREPQQNDKIRWNGFEYLVLSEFGNDSRVYTDGHHTSFRIHTKKTGTV